MDRGAWQATAHGVTKNQIWLSTTTTITFIVKKKKINHLQSCVPPTFFFIIFLLWQNLLKTGIVTVGLPSRHLAGGWAGGRWLGKGKTLLWAALLQTPQTGEVGTCTVPQGGGKMKSKEPPGRCLLPLLHLSCPCSGRGVHVLLSLLFILLFRLWAESCNHVTEFMVS